MIGKLWTTREGSDADDRQNLKESAGCKEITNAACGCLYHISQVGATLVSRPAT